NINLTQIDKWFKANEVVDTASISKKSKITLKKLHAGFKILATGDVTKALTIKGLALSKVAKNKIIAAGGNIE
ncbi:MAG: uL15 family ribosomal protein, partial [Candidatus Shapirobacteria bacterium]|nr:uL15 family ribosomal protein [Candidatus Shapirobacteria bacterium]